MTLRSLACQSFLILSISLPLFGAPKLRLSDTVIGPVSVAAGAAGPSQTVEAWNAGDGTLSLQAAVPATWASVSLGAARNCSTRAGSCIPINIGLLTSSLAAGTYTTVITVSDPNALDAPQTITVTVAMGGGVPDKIELYVAPKGTAKASFSTNTLQPNVPATTQGGGNWLSVGLDGAGSFKFVKTYDVKATWQTGMTDGGTYTGSFTTAGSDVAAENKAVPVTLKVTSGALADIAPLSLTFRVAQDATPQIQYLLATSRGAAALALAAPATSAPWLTASLLGNYVQVMVNPKGLTPGSLSGTVTVNSNAVNGPFSIPVTLEVLAQTPPYAYYGGALTNSSIQPNVAPGTIGWMFGEQFTFKDPAAAQKLPLDTVLNGVKVYLNDKAIPVYYAAYGQINFQIPFDAATGEARISVEREGVRGNSVTLTVNAREPRILTLGSTTYGIIVNQDGTYPLPVSYGTGFRPAKAGDYLTLYALGLGAVAPPVANGAAAPSAPLAYVSVPVQVVINGNLRVDTLFAGLCPGFVGLYQINFQMPAGAPRGDSVNLALRLGTTVVSPTVGIAIQ